MNTKMRRRVTAAASAALLGVTGLAGCATRSSETGSGSSSTPDDVKTDFGVTDDAIKLGVLSDFSVVYGPLAKTVYAGNQIWANEVNADGGICGRQIEFDVQDQKMDTQLANTQYADMKTNVLGIVQLLGSPIISSLLPQIQADHMPTMAGGWSAAYLGVPELVVQGTTYDLDMINGLQYLVDEGLIKDGDAVGQIYQAGDYGENAAAGAEYAAGEAGLEYVGKKVDPTVADISAEMAALKAADVKAILVSTGPKTTAMVASQAPSLGLDGPMLVNGPAYDPALLDSPARAAILKNLYVSSAQAAFTGDSKTQKLVEAAYPEVADDVPPTFHAMGGYAMGVSLGEAMTNACDAGDLTRESVVNELRKLNDFETGVYPPQDYTDPAEPSSTESQIFKATDNPGGLETVKDYFASPVQGGYQN